MTVTTLNVSPKQIESFLLGGQTVDEISTEWQEPRANVLAVLRMLQNDGRITAPVPPPTRPRPALPVHTPAPDVKARIASATEILVRADAIDDKRIQAALSRARKAMTDLAGLVEKYESQHEARTRIEKLERELQEAKAALRGGNPRPSGGAAHDQKAIRAWANANGVNCPKVGMLPRRVIDAYQQANTTGPKTGAA